LMPSLTSAACAMLATETIAIPAMPANNREEKVFFIGARLEPFFVQVDANIADRPLPGISSL
jgi:hypothetical protein